MGKEQDNLRFATIATDAVVFAIIDNVLHVLLIEVNRPPHYDGDRGVPGGIIQVEETAEETVVRVLKEKCGIENIYLEQLYTFSNLKRDPRSRVVSVAYLALMSTEDVARLPLTGGKWQSVTSVKNLAFDHDTILNIAFDRLKAKLQYTNIAMHLLPKRFTLTELQNVYELILQQLKQVVNR